MDRQVTQTSLESLYTQWKASLQFEGDAAHDLGPPLLIEVTEEYCKASRRILVFGQETNGWSWDAPLPPGYLDAWNFDWISTCHDFLSYERSIEALCWGYREFRFGISQSLGNKPFWQAYRMFAKAHGAGVLWNNVVKMDYSLKNNTDKGVSIWNAQPKLRNSIIAQQADLLIGELSILAPNVCVFLSGPDYDQFITTMLPGCQFEACGEAPIRQLARLVHPSLPHASFRTYHPSSLRRQKCWHYLEEIISLSGDPSVDARASGTA